jgi:hypothetical protein
MAMTTWLVSSGVFDQGQAGDFWADLRFPDCHLVDLDTQTVNRHL